MFTLTLSSILGGLAYNALNVTKKLMDKLGKAFGAQTQVSDRLLNIIINVSYLPNVAASTLRDWFAK